MNRRISLVITALVLLSIMGYLVYSRILNSTNGEEEQEFSAFSEGIPNEEILFLTRTRNQCILKTVSTDGVLSELAGFKTPNPWWHHFSLSHDMKYERKG